MIFFLFLVNKSELNGTMKVKENVYCKGLLRRGTDTPSGRML